jgi:hypothetical protein
MPGQSAKTGLYGSSYILWTKVSTNYKPAGTLVNTLIARGTRTTGMLPCPGSRIIAMVNTNRTPPGGYETPFALSADRGAYVARLAA